MFKSYYHPIYVNINSQVVDSDPFFPTLMLTNTFRSVYFTVNSFTIIKNFPDHRLPFVKSKSINRYFDSTLKDIHHDIFIT